MISNIQELLGKLKRQNLVVLYGKPSRERREIIGNMLCRLLKTFDIHIFDISYGISPADLIGIDNKLLHNLYIYHLDLEHLTKLLIYLSCLKINKKCIFIIDPFYVQGAISASKDFDAIYCFYALKHFLTKNRGKVKVWLIVNTTFSNIKRLTFFKYFAHDVDLFVHIYATNSEVRLKLFKNGKKSIS